MTKVRIAWRAVRLFFHLLLGLVLTPLVLRRDPASGEWRTNPYVTSWWLGRIASILNLEITTTGYRPQPPALIISNHVSWLDIVVLGHLTPTCFLSKDEVRKWPLIGWLAARAGTLFIRRGGGQANSISQAIGGRLVSNGLLTLFPEGTTTDGRSVRPFFSRLFAAAIDTGTPIVPTSLRYHTDGEYDPIAPYIDEQSLGENLLGLMSRAKNQVHVHFAEPIRHHGMDRKTLAETTRKVILESLAHTGPGTPSEAPEAPASKQA